MRTVLGDFYGYEYRDPIFKDFPNAKRIAFIDESADYEVDQTAILVDGDTFILALASGCSCWDGDWQLFRFDTVEELLEDIGPQGEGDDYSYNPSFEGVKDLAQQVEAWRNA